MIIGRDEIKHLYDLADVFVRLIHLPLAGLDLEKLLYNESLHTPEMTTLNLLTIVKCGF